MGTFIKLHEWKVIIYVVSVARIEENRLEALPFLCFGLLNSQRKGTIDELVVSTRCHAIHNNNISSPGNYNHSLNTRNVPPFKGYHSQVTPVAETEKN
jgi:hypothetical protein